jgi:hypothetical protein
LDPFLDPFLGPKVGPKVGHLVTPLGALANPPSVGGGVQKGSVLGVIFAK